MDVERIRATDAPEAPRVAASTAPRRKPLGFVWPRPRPQPAPAPLRAPRAPERTSAWLHVVSGHGVEAIARGAFELAARSSPAATASC